MSGLYRSMYARRTNRFRGYLFGVAIGEALMKKPFENIIHNKSKIRGENNPTTRHINITPESPNLTGVWSTLTYQYLIGSLTMVRFKKCYGDGTELFDKSFMADRLAEASDNFADKFSDHPTLLGYKPHQILFKAAPAMMISQASHMNISQLITFITHMGNISQHRPIDIFPIIELIYLMLSVFRSVETIPDAYNELSSFMKKSRLRAIHNFQEYEQYRFRPLTDIDPDSSLWLLRNVSDILGVTPGEKWSNIPEFLPGLFNVKNESLHPDAAGALAGLILGGYAGYAGAEHRASSEFSLHDNIPDELIKKLWKTHIIEDLAGNICTNFGWGGMSIGRRNPRPKQEKKLKQPQRLRPSLIYQSSKELPCAFLTLIVKNKFLQEKYPGGVRAFATKHWSLANNRINIMCHMSDEFQDVMLDLQGHGLSKDDYSFIDFGGFITLSVCYSVEEKSDSTIISKEKWIEEHMNRGVVNWLHVKERNNRYYVSYVEGGVDKEIEALL